MKPIVSLIMAVYNRETYLAQAIESVLAQTEPNFEFIIIDDGSTDSSIEIAQQYAQADARIRLIQGTHQGQGLALSTAFSVASGKYLGQLDSDDWLDSKALSETIKVLEALPDVSMVYSNYYDVDANGRTLHLGHRCKISYSKERLLLDFMTFHFRLFRKTAFVQIGGIDPQFECAPDYDLSLKLSEVGEIVHLEKPLYFYRQHQHSISASKRLQQMDYAHRAVSHAIKRRGLSEHVSIDLEVQPKLVLKRKPAPNTYGSEKVFGVGLGKTGTTSLSTALSHLGYRTIHLPKSAEGLEKYDAAADVSVAIAFRQLDWLYPNAKFILTLRPVDTWLASWHKHDLKVHEALGDTLPDSLRQLRIRVFGQPNFEAEVWKRAYLRHCREVANYFKARPQKLLIYKICDGEGWKSLCQFLSKPIPMQPFPHENTASTPYVSL